MKKTPTSNFAGFIRIDKEVLSKKTVSPSVKSAKSSEVKSNESGSSSRSNADSVYRGAASSDRLARRSGDTSISSKASTVSNSKQKFSKMSSSTQAKNSSKEIPKKESKDMTKNKSSPKEMNKKVRHSDVSFVQETQGRFQAINENLAITKTPERHISESYSKTTSSISHTDQFERTLVLTSPRVEAMKNDENKGYTDAQMEDDAYEDDFEDYESDFESFSSSLDEDSVDSQDHVRDSTKEPRAEIDDNLLKVAKNIEEEKKLDSGVYELTMVEKKQRNEIKNIKKAIEEENAQVAARISGTKDNMDDESSLDLSNRFEFINFEEALHLESKKKKNVKRKKRSDYLLDMIKLYQQSFSVYDAPPIPYEAYIKCYGRSNTQQNFVQTHEDDLDEEVQTEAIDTRIKWTQCPLSFSLANVETVQQLKRECRGVGDVVTTENDVTDEIRKGFEIGFGTCYESIEKVSEIVLALLEEEASQPNGSEDQSLHSGIFENNSRDLKFSDQFINLGVDRVGYLSDRPVKKTLFCKKNDLRLITVHEKQTSRRSTSELQSRCILCQWNISQPSTPLAQMVANSDVTCVECEDPNLVLAGMEDGSISVWDLRERVITDEVKLRPPSYNTAAVVKLDHVEKVVSLNIAHDTDSKEESNQVFSLTQSGTLNMWTLFRNQNSKHFSTVDLGQSYWGNIRLILLRTLNINQNLISLNLEYTCMTLLNQEIFIGVSNGSVQHLSMTSLSCLPSSYLSNTDEHLEVKCIEHCPYENDYFLVGYSNGQVKMYNKKRENPLISFAGTGDPCCVAVDVRYICWSKHRLGLFFVLDSESRLHMWDLCKSDMYPMYSIPLLTTGVINLDLSPNCLGSVQSSFLVLGTSSGRVEIHRIKKELGKQTEAEFKKDRSKFLKYVSIL